MNDLTILVNSCDLYSSVWEPFFRLFKIQWPDCPYDFVLNTETKKYAGSLDNVRTINTPNAKTWSKRLRNVLEQIDTEYVLFMLEDYFVLSPINVEVFERGHNLLKSNNQVGMVSFVQTNKTDVDKGSFDDEDFFNRIINERSYIACLPAIWRREYLLKIIRDHETIWQFEQYASFRINRRKEIVLNQKNNKSQAIDYKAYVAYGFGITCKKWLPGNKALFEKYNIPVNFDELGWLDEGTINSLIAARNKWIAERDGVKSTGNESNKSKKDKAKTDKNKANKDLKECLYSIKHFFIVQKKKLRKKYHLYLSKR